ncbi:MAG: hypothetical protein ABI222_11125, partial [Opitutaceae bacterium]
MTLRIPCSLLAVGLALVSSLRADESTPAEKAAGLHLLAKIPVPGMTGTWDHLAADPATARLFANAQDIHTLEIFDLKTNRWVRAVTGPFNRNQGAEFLADTHQLAISNGRSGTVTFLDGATLAPPG